MLQTAEKRHANPWPNYCARQALAGMEPWQNVSPVPELQVHAHSAPVGHIGSDTRSVRCLRASHAATLHGTARECHPAMPVPHALVSSVKTNTH